MQILNMLRKNTSNLKNGNDFPSEEGEVTMQHVRSRADLLRQQSASLLRQSTTSSLFRQVSGFYWPPGADSLIERISLYYATGWPSPHCHYTSSSLDKLWTPLPGRPLVKVSEKVELVLHRVFPKILGTQDSKFSENIYELHLNSLSNLEFVFTDDGTHWDKHCGRSNYFIHSPGRYLVKNGVIHQIFDPPEKPSLVCAAEIGSSYVKLTWSCPIVRAETVNRYRIYKDGSKLADVDAKILEFTDKDLLSCTKYRYEVAAVNHNEIQGRVSEAIEATTGEPGKPGPVEAFRISSITASDISLTWRRPLNTGGLPIVSHVVFRNQAFVSCVPATKEEWEVWKDDTIDALSTYIYHVVPTRYTETELRSVIDLDQVKAETAPKENEIFTYLEENFVKKDINIGYICTGIQTKVSSPTIVPHLWDKTTHIMLQAFNWDSCSEDVGWYSFLMQRAEMLEEAAISIIWLPPPSQSVSPQGYMPTRWYNLNSEYGTEHELLDLIESMRAHKITPMLDFVVNHRCGVKKDNQGEWTIFEDPPWESWAIVKNNLVGYTGLGELDTGAQSQCAPDIDHTNSRVREDIKAWATWLFDLVGFGAIRIDMSPGYGPRYQVEYVRHLKTPFAVGEYWSGDSRVLMDYIRACGGQIAVFDFALYYMLRRSVESNNFGELSNNGRPPGLIGQDPERAVTFIENHDTSHLDIVGKFARGDINAVMRGMVYILTHPGIPCIYWDHFYDNRIYKQISLLCRIRKEMGISSRCGIYIDAAHEGLYAAYISPDNHCPRGGGAIALKIGTNDWSPNGSWNYRLSGHQYCVWSK